MTHFTLPGATPWLAFIYHQEIKKKNREREKDQIKESLKYIDFFQFLEFCRLYTFFYAYY